MLDLQSSHNYWHEYGDSTIYRVVTFMESLETWTKDGDSRLEEAIQELSDILNSSEKYGKGEEAHFIQLATYLKMPRLLRMLQTIDQLEPGSASKVLMHAEERNGKDDTITLFLRRNIVFERLRLLSRVFSPTRFSIVLKALQNE